MIENRPPHIGDAVISLRPGVKITVRGTGEDAVVIWEEDIDNKPTDAEIQTELTRLQAEYDAKEYQRNRQPEYPDIGDQLDDLFKAGAFSTEMAAKIQAVKDKYPKDNT